ncbi:unnamed protein product [Phytophthora fragariaefolia]|uniref:Unnamed protein product n=1 Tax=Phytophthora fragariaefolia TaxID=1490495 RepID=A0A9W6U4K9_9STRA|nr:unnamed protein product [Phytophthora fragariaefolia]
MNWKRFARDLPDGRIEQICILSDVERIESEAEELKQLVTEGTDAVSAKSKKECFDEQSWNSLKSSPLRGVLREYKDVLLDDIPAELPQDKCVQHEIDLVPGTNAPTFCVKKAQGGWRIIHAYNKLNDATVPAQTPIPRKDVIIDSMGLSTLFSAFGLMDGFYQILMRENDIPLTAVSTPGGMFWKWLVMPQGLKNAPATFNGCVTHLLRSVREFTPSYFDDVFIHSRAVNGKSEVEMHQEHLRKSFALMRKHKLYANLTKCIFGASEIPVLGCLVGENGVRHDPGKVRVINEWPTPLNVKELRQFLGLATYLCNRQFVVYTDHASLRSAIKSPHISQRMAMWVLLFAEYNLQVEPKRGRLNVVADALSRRPDYAVHKTDANAIGVLLNYFAAPSDKSRQKLAKHLRARVHQYRVHNGLLLYSAVGDNADRVAVPDDRVLKLRITYEYHDAPTSGHSGREKTYLLLARDFYWSHQYNWVEKYVRACEVCHRVKPRHSSLPTPSECWQSISMDCIFGLPSDNKRRTGIEVFVDRFSKMVHLAAVPAEVTAKRTARLFEDMVYRHHGMPIDICQLSMSTADHPQTDGQTERVNRVLVDALKSYAYLFHHWSDCLLMAEFAINNSVHASTGHTPFYVNALRHPRVPSVLGTVAPSLSGGGYPVLAKPKKHAYMTNRSAVSTCAWTARRPVNESTVSTPGVDTLNINEQHTQAGPVVNKDAELNAKFSSMAMDYVQRRQAVIRFVQDAIAASVDRQKLNADNKGMGNTNEFKVGSLVLLATQNLDKHAVSDFGASNRAPRFIGPFTVLAKHGNAYTLDIPSSMRLHPTFYVGRLKPYAQNDSLSLGDSAPTRVRKTASFDPRSTCTFEAICATCASCAFDKASSCFNAANSAVWRRSTAPEDQQSLADQTRGVFLPPPPPLRDAQVATRWIVQRIVGRQIQTHGPDHFRIRWKGFPLNHDTWEPRNVLMRDVPELVMEYKARHHQSRRRA